VIEGDAGQAGIYAGSVPAGLVLACGVFGNVSDEDIRRTIGFIPALCAPGARVIWTRDPREEGIMTAIQDSFKGAGFRPHALIVGEGNLFGVGAAVLTVPPLPFRPNVPLFTSSSRSLMPKASCG
jgi:hypothetical protein